MEWGCRPAPPHRHQGPWHHGVAQGSWPGCWEAQGLESRVWGAPGAWEGNESLQTPPGGPPPPAPWHRAACPWLDRQDTQVLPPVLGRGGLSLSLACSTRRRSLSLRLTSTEKGSPPPAPRSRGPETEWGRGAGAGAKLSPGSRAARPRRLPAAQKRRQARPGSLGGCPPAAAPGSCAQANRGDLAAAAAAAAAPRPQPSPAPAAA